MTAAPSPTVIASERSPPPLWRRVLHLLPLAAFIAVLVRIRVPLCPSVLLFEHPCPGCGLTRSGKALLAGELATAWAFHPLGLIIVPALSWVIGSGVVRYLWRGRFMPQPAPRWWFPATAAIYGALILVWVVRELGGLGGPVSVGPLPEPGAPIF